MRQRTVTAPGCTRASSQLGTESPCRIDLSSQKTPPTGLIGAGLFKGADLIRGGTKNQSAAGLQGGLFQSPSIKNDKPESIDQPSFPALS